MKHFLLTVFISLACSTVFSSNLQTQHAKDLQLVSVPIPKTTGALTDNETVRFSIKNLGTEIVSTFTVGFSLDGGSTFKEEVVNQTVNPNETIFYTFSSNFALMGTDGATYNITGKITLAGDEDLSNNEQTKEVINLLVGDVDDEPIEITSFPYFDSKEYVMYNGDYMSNFSISNYMQEEDVVYSFTTVESPMYVDAKVTANWAGSISPRPSVVLINKKPSSFGSFDTELGKGYGDWSGSFENAYCYAAQTYYIIVDKWRDYSCTYDLEVNLYRQHDFKFFNFESLSVEGDVDYDNRIVTLTVPPGTDVSSLAASFELPTYTEVLVGSEVQTSGSTAIDFTNDVTYTINQTISPNATQTWTVKVIEGTTTNIKSSKLEGVSIAPNPVKDEIWINTNQTISIDKISVFNASGSLVLSETKLKQGQALPVYSLKTGIYFILIESNGKQTIQKFIKK